MPPLPGGPADKLGNRYELRWVVRRLVDLITGRLAWIRVEPPGENAIEFRDMAGGQEEAYQVKRGVPVGHWTIASLGEVLDGFGSLLASNDSLECVFASEHAAPELKELTERARGAMNATELVERFLAAKPVAKAWQAVQARWEADPSDTWKRLRRIAITTVSERHLLEDTDTILRLLFADDAGNARAALVEIAIEAVHQHLTRADLVSRLDARGIRLIESGHTVVIAKTTNVPVSTGVPREAELKRMKDLIDGGVRTLFIGGITGIGKTTVAAQFAAGWKHPVCWIDCGLITSETEAMSTLAEFATKTLKEESLVSAVNSGGARIESLGRLAGTLLGAKKCAIMWDGLDGEIETRLRPVIDAISSTISGGLQLVTSQGHYESGRASAAGTIHVGRLDKEVVRQLLVQAYPDCRLPEIEAADEATRGHPYLLRLLIGSAESLDLQTALLTVSSSDGVESFARQLLERLPEQSRVLLKDLAWLGVPFEAVQISRLGGTPGILKDLAKRYLILRASSDRYRVHEIVAKLLRTSVTKEEAVELHQRAALFLRGMDDPSWGDVRAALLHAREAHMDEVARQAGAALLTFATDSGYVDLAREAAEAIVRDPLGATWFFPHFILGKSARIADELDAALTHYSNAEKYALQPRDREMARYERASVLRGLNRDEEASLLYVELAKSTEPATRVEANIALALGAAHRGAIEEALTVLADTQNLAAESKLVREQSEAFQAKAEILASEERWEEARSSILRAHELRYPIADNSKFDIYGWLHLFKLALTIERALGNREAARSAAHGLWRVALLSGSLGREANAAHALCLSEPDENDPEVKTAVRRLGQIGRDPSNEPSARVEALGSLVLCEWSLRHYEASIEAIAEVAAIGEEHRIPIPMFGHLVNYPVGDENVVLMPGGGYGLIVPRGKSSGFVKNIVSKVFKRRPELAQYSALLVGVPKRK